MLPLLWLACTPGAPTDPGGDDDDDVPPPPTDPTGGTGSTLTTASTGHTGETAEPFDCDDVYLPIGPVPMTVHDIVTTEDFDFDALGYLVYSDWQNFVAVDFYGNQVLLSPGINDTRGIQFLSDGNFVAAYITE